MAYNSETGLFDGFIYCIENQINHKKYVGQTSTTIAERFRNHLYSANHNWDTYLYRAMRLHGAHNFVIYELSMESSDSKESLQIKLNELEKFYISELDTYAPNGYNMTEGGRIFAEPASRSVCMVSEDGDVLGIYPSIREAGTSTGINETNIQHACQTPYHYSTGFFWYYNDELKTDVGENIGKQHRGVNNTKGHVTYPGKPILMFSKEGELLGEFASAAYAARVLDLSQGGISACCLHKRKSCGGYKWAFAN